MAEFTQPSEIAREALRRIAIQRLQPTPDVYCAMYNEIAGNQAEDIFPARALGAIARSLPRSTPEALARALDFERAVNSGQWPELRRALIALSTAGAAEAPAWSGPLRELIGRLQGAQLAGTIAARLHELETTLNTPPFDNEVLHGRLQALLRSWNLTVPSEAPGSSNEAAPRAPLAQLLAPLLREGIAPMLADSPTLAAEANALLSALQAAQSAQELSDRLRSFSLKLEWLGEDQRAIREGLLNLLRLVIDNIEALVFDDQWLRGQIAILSETFSRPLDIRILDEVERRLREVIGKQTELKAALTQAQERLKMMLAGFVDRLSEFSDSTDTYEQRLEISAEQIKAARDISELSEVVERILSDTRNAREVANRSHRELNELRELVAQANQQIVRLQRELDETSDLVRHDPLTGTLNRKGLDETLAREISRARRRGTPLCLSLLDIDNFKQLNDTHGHSVGDDALRHLSAVVREHLRPQDAVGRYGGEEFVIVLPDTELAQGAEIMARLQRILTKRFFLAGNQRLLITFSAGVAQLNEEESPQDCIARADHAMYAAKRAGKNRVLTAP